MATSTNFVTSLGAGSGIDIKSLAQSLVDAEQAPRKERIDEKIKVSETKISGYGALKYSLSQLKNSFATLDDAREFSSIQVSNSQSSAFSITATTSAQPASFSVEVQQLAKPQRMTAAIFDSKTESLGVNAPFDLSVNMSSGSQTITVNQATPEGLAAAINASTSRTQLRAQLINTGQGHQLVLTGATGVANAFTLTAPGFNPVAVASTVNLNQQGGFTHVSAHASATSVALNFQSNGQSDSIDLIKNQSGLWVLPDGDTLPDDATALTSTATRPYFYEMQSAQNALMSVDGISITSASNEITDAIEGVTFNLASETQVTAKVDLMRDTNTIKSNLRSLVASFNEFSDGVKVLQDRSSEVEIFGGALAGDTLTRRLYDQIRQIFVQDAQPSATKIKAARDVGLTLDRFGKLSLDEDKLDQALATDFSEVVSMFTANKNDKSVYSASNAGLAGGAFRSLDQMLRSTSLLNQQTQNETQRIDGYKENLEKLQTQMDRLLERYMQQFSIMDSIVGESSSTRQSLKNSLDSLNNKSD